MSRLIEQTRAQLRTLARMPEIRAMNASANARLAEVLGDEPIYTSLVIADPVGEVVGSAIPFQGEVRFDHFDFLQENRRHQVLFARQIQFQSDQRQARIQSRLSALGTRGQAAWSPHRFPGILVDRRFHCPGGSSERSRNGYFRFRRGGSSPHAGTGTMGRQEYGQGIIWCDNSQTGRRRQGCSKGVDGVERLYAYAPIRSGTAETNAYLAVGIPYVGC